MAAAMFRRFHKISGSILHKYAIRSATTDSAYYVLIPEIPPDTEKNNPVMCLDGFPAFNAINPDNVITGCAKRAIEFETDVGKLFEALEDPTATKTFETVLDTIEKLLVPMETAWRTAKHLNYVKGTEGYRFAFQRIRERVDKARNERWLSESLYNAVKEINADGRNLTEFQQALVDKYLLEGRLNGIEIYAADKKKFLKLVTKLAQAKSDFRERVMVCHGMFSHTCSDYDALKDVPKPILDAISLNKRIPSMGPWRITLHQDIVRSVLECCHDRMLRWNVWQAYNNRASINFNTQNLTNHKLIGEIKMWRKDIANLLGYDNFAQMSMETKMAGSIQEVMNMIETYKMQFKPTSQEEIQQLNHFAKSAGFPHDQLEMWDIAYWRRKQKHTLFNFDEEDLCQYFPLPPVLDGLFGLCNQLFGIQIKASTSPVDVWHPSVVLYNIFDSNDNYVASFYLDPYVRVEEKVSGAWMEPGRERSEVVGTTPFSYLNLNLPTPLPDRPALLSLQDVDTVFAEFGHGLQQMLTKVPYSEIAGQKNVEWDALQVCANFMKMWLNVPSVVQSISKHHESGEPMPTEKINAVITSKKHMKAYDMIRSLYLSAYDMELHVSDGHWNNTMEKVWADFMPVKLHEEDNHPCCLTAIFSDQYTAAYYSVIWSEMIAADVFGAFQEVGFENKEKITALGHRFRETFLSLGGGVPASEIFRKFRGRDPSPETLINMYSNTES